MPMPLRTAQDEKELLIETAISDLFFHMEHKEYKKLMTAQRIPLVSEISEAIESDAIRMQYWLSELGHSVTVSQLVNDFFARVEIA